MNTVKYKNHNLSKNSDAYALLDKKEFEKLDKHLAEVDRMWVKSNGNNFPAHLVNYRIGDHLSET